MTERDRDLLLGRIDGKLDTVLIEVQTIKERVPSECAVHKERLQTHERSICRLWVLGAALALIVLVVGGEKAAAYILKIL